MITGRTKTAFGVLLAAMLASGPSAFAADTDLPLIMTMNTNIYGYQGPTNAFTIYLGSTEENVEIYVETASVQEYVEVDPWSLGQDEEGGNTAIATAIALNVTENDGSIRIYGDKSKIDYIDVHGCYMNSVVLEGEFPNLSVIDLSHNELTSIDLSQQVNLASIDLLDNAFNDASKMIIGTNHPDLMILSVGINDVIDPNLNLRNFPNLQYFSARNNYGLYDVDPTNCPNLVSLVLEVTNVSSVDVSKNPNLDVLNLSQTRVTSVDLSNNKKLGEFYINHEGTFNSDPQYKVKNIDLSNNPLLQYLDLGGNALTSIDLSNNHDLRLIYLQRNLLSSIDVSNMPKLAVLNLSNNLFDFATLPIPQEGWDYYYYRGPLSCDLKYKVNEPINFSEQVIRGPFTDNAGNTITPETYAAVFATPKAADEYEVPSSKYTFDNGVITFKEAIPDSVYVQFYCDVFPDWTLNSSNFMVKTAADFDAPAAAFSFTPSAEMAGKQVSLSMGAALLASSVSYPGDVTIISGDSQSVLSGVITGAGMPGSNNITFTVPAGAGEITLAMPDGFSLSNLAIDGIALESINLDGAEGLTNLKINNCGLSEIKLSYNRALRSLDLSNNNLTAIDLTGIRGDYQKWQLENVNLANNKINRYNSATDEVITTLNLSGNNFSSFNLKYFTNLQNVDLSNNRLNGELDLSTIESLRNANFSGNNISSIVLNSGEEALDYLASFNVAGNNLTLATLPLLESSVNYVYAPQQKMSILTSASAVNLSAQNITVNGGSTTYTWKYAENNEVVPASLITNNDGAILFDNSLVGTSLYCEMTNTLFPQFNSQPLTTTNVTVASRPTNMIASFVTAQNGTAQIGFRFNKEGDNAVYIDWRGDGTEYEPYVYEALGDQTFYRSGTTYAGATAKIYSYDDASTISVIGFFNTPLTSLDLSQLTSLTAADIHGARLTDGSLKLPDTNTLFELVLDGNSFTEESFADYKGVSYLNLAGNNYTSFDFSGYGKLRTVILADNKISNVTFDGNSFSQLDLSENNLSTLDLTGLNSVNELLVPNNNLSSLDLSPVISRISALNISGNKFTFATLPDVSGAGENLGYYSYANQQPMEVTCSDMQINLSSQANINGTPTVYLWFLGDFQNDVYFDYEMEMFIGEQLEGPDDSDDPEYTIENGITTFLYPQTRNVICAMTNAEYPNLILYTAPTRVTDAGIESIFGVEEDGLVDVYTLSGIRVKSKVSIEEAFYGLEKGIYIVNGKKVAVK